jgi:hypothetical protein
MYNFLVLKNYLINNAMTQEEATNQQFPANGNNNTTNS